MSQLPQTFLDGFDSIMAEHHTDLFLRRLDGLIAEGEGGDYHFPQPHGYRNQVAGECRCYGCQWYQSHSAQFYRLGFNDVWDYALMPLLACWRHEALRGQIEKLFDFFLEFRIPTSRIRTKSSAMRWNMPGAGMTTATCNFR